MEELYLYPGTGLQPLSEGSDFRDYSFREILSLFGYRCTWLGEQPYIGSGNAYGEILYADVDDGADGFRCLFFPWCFYSRRPSSGEAVLDPAIDIFSRWDIVLRYEILESSLQELRILPPRWVSYWAKAVVFDDEQFVVPGGPRNVLCDGFVFAESGGAVPWRIRKDVYGFFPRFYMGDKEASDSFINHKRICFVERTMPLY